MQFLLEPTNPLNGVLYSEHGGPWKSTLTQSVTLGLSDRFALDVQFPDLALAGGDLASPVTSTIT